MKRTAMPDIAGVVNIAIGSINLLGVLGTGIALIIIGVVVSGRPIVITILGAVFAVLLILGLPSLIGGIFALRRKNWVVALIGSIASLMLWNLIGLIPLILVILSREEFEN